MLFDLKEAMNSWLFPEHRWKPRYEIILLLAIRQTEKKIRSFFI
jgi:hypothetical protein